MKKVIRMAHWIAYGYLSMMENMNNFGFGKTWTLFIGYGELLGIFGLVVGFWIHQIKNLSIIWLFPFAVGALMVHVAYNDYTYLYTALHCCIACIIALMTDKNFKLIL